MPKVAMPPLIVVVVVVVVVVEVVALLLLLLLLLLLALVKVKWLILALLLQPTFLLRMAAMMLNLAMPLALAGMTIFPVTHHRR